MEVKMEQIGQEIVITLLVAQELSLTQASMVVKSFILLFSLLLSQVVFNLIGMKK
jgi:hypothetical protein